MAQLEARRQALLARSEAQRVDLAERVAQLKRPLGWLQAGVGAAAARAEAARPVHHPLVWIVAAVGLILLGRPRQVLALLAWTRSALSVLSRASQILNLIAALRRTR